MMNGHSPVVDDVIRRHPGHVVIRSANGRVIASTGTVVSNVNSRVTSPRNNDTTSGARMTSPANGDEPTKSRQYGDDSERPAIELFVKAGKDGQRLGGCPLCQRVYFALAVKSNNDVTSRGSTSSSNGSDVTSSSGLSFVVTPVNMARPPPDFRKLQPSTRRLPVLVHRRQVEHRIAGYDVEVLTDPDDILQYIDQLFPFPVMSYDTAAPAAVVCRDVFSRFSYFVKDVSGSSAPLIAELRRLDAHLSAAPFRYLNGDRQPDHLDCLVLPKLQHIRVAARAVKDFEIPAELVGLWGYLATAYADPVFRRTCPSDQEIVHHWQSKPECHRVPKSKQVFYSPEGPPRYSMDVPASVKQDMIDQYRK